MSVSNLKLTKPQDQDSDVLFMERRRASRRPLSGQVTAVTVADAGPGSLRKINTFQLLNISDQGLGVISQTEVQVGHSVSVYFAPHGAETGFDLHGQVVRCRQRHDGYELGIALNQAMAA